jgi:hypothetical protein
VVDFKNTVIIMTTNLGTRDIAKGQNLGFNQSGDAAGSYERMKAKVTEELKQHFRPEFLNRVDEMIVFPPLSKDQIIKMVDNMIASVELRMKDRDMSIELTQDAKDLLAARGFDPVLGARPLRRTIQREIEDVLAEKMLFGEVGPGQIVLVDVEGEDGPTKSFTFKGTRASRCPTRCRWRPRSVPPLAVPTTPRARSTCPVRRAASSTQPDHEGPDPRVVRPSCCWVRVRQGRANRPSGSATTRPSVTSEASARSRWVGSGQAASSAARSTLASVARSTARSRPRHWRSVPVVGLRRARRPGVGGSAGRQPRAATGDRDRRRSAVCPPCRPERRAP